jgi:hypothetical protein
MPREQTDNNDNHIEAVGLFRLYLAMSQHARSVHCVQPIQQR